MGFFDTLGIKCVNELAIREKRVFLRTDFNFPVDEDGNIADLERINKAVPTIKHILEHNARLIIASHFGRPESEKDAQFTLEPFAAKLAEILEQDIYFFEDCVGMGAMQMVRDLKPGQILVLENLRFNSEEKKNSSAFARELAKMCDVYINDAFGVCHRKDTSIALLPRFIDTKGVSFAVKQEVEELSKFIGLEHGSGLSIMLGGSNISDKTGLIRPMLDMADKIIVGGPLAYTFMAAQGVYVGSAPVDEEKIPLAKEILKSAKVRKVEIVLPVDHVIAETVNSTEPAVCKTESFPEGMAPFDIGPETVELFAEKIAECKHLFWSGPMGVYEKPQFSVGSLKLAQKIASLPIHKVAGGGDTEEMLRKAGFADKFDYVFTGGTAALEFLKSDGMIPGLEALKD
ncbi:phosphoglycerate kinase [bacterium]|nr:phosphoglycerate kinase [bacterium]MBP5591817.1 phosphoglycerate kinase [bacterium]